MKNYNDSNRARWFRRFKGFLRIFVRKPKYVFLGSHPENSSIIMLNHVGASSPVLTELYFEPRIRFWGTYEMTEGLKSARKYLTTTYLHDKKHMPKIIAKILGTIISPFVNIFYKGLKLIPTYKDMRFAKTYRLTVEALDKGEKLVIFPEDSHDGYHDHLTHFYSGGIYIAEKYLPKKDLTIYVGYYIKKLRTFIFDKGYKYTELKEKYQDNDSISEFLCERCNELGESYLKEHKK